MRLTTSLLGYLLGHRLSLAQKIHFPSEHYVDSVRLFSSQPLQGNVLYLVTDGMQEQAWPLSEEASYLVLSDGGKGLLVAGNTCAVTQPLEGMDWNQTALTLLQEVAQILLDFSHWEQTFLRLKGQNAGIRAYYEVISQFYDGPLLLVDRHSEILGGAQKNAADYFGNPDAKLDREEIKDLMLGKDFQANCRKTDFFDVKSLAGDEVFLCRNFLRNGNYLGHVSVRGKSCATVEPGELALLRLIVEILEPAMFAHIDQRKALGKNGEVHTLLLDILGEPAKKNAACAELAALLRDFGWEAEDQLCVISLCFFDGISTASSGSYVCNILEEQWCDSFAVIYKNQIYWVLNCTKHKIGEQGEQFKDLIVGTVDAYICRAGISYFFRDMHQLEVYIRQARIALELGQKEKPHHWYHFFGDYALAYMTERIEAQYTVEQIAHRGLLRLMEYDRVHKTGYVRALRVYLQCDRNVSRAAELLFLHRSSLTRQLARMEEIMGDMAQEDFQQDLYLRMSLLLLEKRKQA